MEEQEDRPTSDKSPLSSSSCQAGTPPPPSSSSSPLLLLPLCCMAVPPLPLQTRVEKKRWNSESGGGNRYMYEKNLLSSEKERRLFIG